MPQSDGRFRSILTIAGMPASGRFRRAPAAYRSGVKGPRLPHNGRLLRPPGSRAFPIYPGCDARGLNAVIGGLMPGDLTLDLFQRLPANQPGFSAARAPSARKHETIAP